MPKKKFVNHGVIPGPLAGNWPIGSIPHQVRNPSGNWLPFLVMPEKQTFRNVETMACVSFATNNMAEMQIKHQSGVEVNFSDRWLAKLSGTTMQGNWVSIVLDTFRKNGGVLEGEWPVPPEPFAWPNYYSDIPQWMIARGKKVVLDKYDMQYEYVSDHRASVVQHHLQHAPLMITIPGHEVVGVKLEGDNLTIFDTYPFSENFTRVVKLSDITDIFKAVVTVKGQAQPMEIVNDNGTYYIVGELGKMGINGPDALEFWRKITAKERSGSTAGIPVVHKAFERLGFGVDED